MKYAIQSEYWWFDTHEYIDRKNLGWVQRIYTAKFKEKNKTPRVHHVQSLSEAKLYDTFEQAEAVAHLISSPKTPAEVVVISDKRLFEAKLKGI